MISEQSCFVYIVLPNTTEFVTAARFEVTMTRDGNPVGKLVYGKKYLARTDAVALDPLELRLEAKLFQTATLQGFFGAIRDAMPDYWGRCVIERHMNKPVLTEFDYLLHGPDDRAGALGFGLNVEPPAPQRHFNQTLNLAEVQRNIEMITQDTNHIAEDTIKTRQVQELLLVGTSMGGARPKAVIEDNQTLWIAKFSTPQDAWNQPRVEHAYLQLAKVCHLNVADSKIINIAGKDVLLVRRFDRDYAETGYLRHRMISALTLLQAEESPLAREKWSYLLLADEIRRTSHQPKADLHELYKRMCFNAIVSNLDDHPRNHALLAKGHDWRLSPAYDLTPTLTIAQDSRLLAMVCGDYGRVASQTNLLTAHDRFLLTLDEAKYIIDHIVNTVRQQHDACLHKAGVSARDMQKIASAFIYDGFFY